MNIASQFVKVGPKKAKAPAETSEAIALDLSRIRLDGDTQSRADIIDSVVDEYAEAIAAGAEFPPVTVFRDGSRCWLADGFHRYHAHQRAKKTTIMATVKVGTKRDAILYSVGANASHGLRRNNDDKRRSALTLLSDVEWSKWSDREIARRCAVSQPFVSSLRPAREAQTDNGYQSETRTYVHPKSGKPTQMNTGAIGKAPKPEADPAAPQVAEEQWVEERPIAATAPAEDHSAFHQQARDSLPQAIKDRDQAKAEWQAKAKAGRGAQEAADRIAELQESIRVLEVEAEELRAENKTYREMKVQFEQGGFDKVIAGKDEEIRVLLTRVETESRDKAEWANSAKFWKDAAIKLGWSSDVVIDIATGEVVDGDRG